MTHPPCHTASLCILLTSLGCTPVEPSEKAAGGEAVSLETRDGVTLSGDYYSGTAEAPGLVLLHMNPAGGNDRSNWPAAFIEQLHENRWHLLVIDRRGSGSSGGEAQEAFEGENGRYDVEIGALFLEEEGAGALGLIGASNGTTSLLDYTVWAPDEGLPEPTLSVLLTGGSYTENQNSFHDFPSIPSLFCYASDEASWSETQQTDAPENWSFQEYPDGGHGTRLFDTTPEVSDDIETFLLGAL